MINRCEYEKSISLIKEAESLIEESRTLLNDIKGCIKDKDNDSLREIVALKEYIHSLNKINDNLYMENALLKSKVQELSMMISKAQGQDNLLRNRLKSIKE